MDIFLFQKINQWAGKWIWLDILGIYFAQYFEYVLIFCLLLFLFFNFKKYWKMIIWSFVAAFFSRLIITNLIRWVFLRTRPFVENKVNLLFEVSPTSSFPSGHASFYFALATLVFLFLWEMKKPPKLWWQISLFFFFSAFIISFARVFSGVHWSSDILVGIAVGVFSGWLVNKMSKKF